MLQNCHGVIRFYELAEPLILPKIMFTAYENRPTRLFAYVLVTVFSSEAAVMFVLPYLVSESTHKAVAAFLDAILLTVMLSPMLWLVVVGPLRKLAIMRQAILGAALSAQEDERRRLARELHDGLGQGMTALLVGLRTIEETSGDEAVKQLARDLRRVGSESHDEVRRIARGLRPAVLDDAGIVPALERFLNDVSTVYKVHAHLNVECGEGSRLTEELEAALYRIVQEAVVNAVRHGQATQIEVTIRCRTDRIELEVQDNGQGFDLHAAMSRKSGTGPFGLISIRERARLIGGDAVIESSPESGTLVKVHLPFVSPG